jgi:hypothetical protein
LPLPPNQKAELYESLRVPLRWNLKNSVITRTRNWKPVRSIFYHSDIADQPQPGVAGGRVGGASSEIDEAFASKATRLST